MFPPDYSPRERRTLWGITALLLALLILPYMWAWLTTPGDGHYSGFLYNPDDQNVHLAWARQARDGSFFVRDLFTTESLVKGERPLFNNVLTFAIGVVSRVTTLPLVVVYHAVRLLFAALAVWWFAALCAHLTPDKRVRTLAVALMAFGGGIGWLQGALPGRIFIDNPESALTMPEAFTFLSAFVFPLFIASVALLPFIYLQTWRARETGNLRYAVYAGLAALVLTNIHTYDAVPLNVVMLVWAVASFSKPQGVMASPGIARARWLAPLIVVAFTLPQIAYQFFVLGNSEEFRVKALSPKPAPSPIDMALSYAPLLILTILAVVVLFCQIRGRGEQRPSVARGAWVMGAWAVVTFVMIYTPVSFARKMIEGVHLPLCFLAAVGLVWVLDKAVASRQAQRFVAAVFVGVMSVSSLQFVTWCLNNAADVQNETPTNQRRAEGLMPPLYLPNETVRALQFLNGRDEPRDRAVLIFPTTGNYVPRETGFYTYAGHFDETLYFPKKLSELRRFYDGSMSESEAQTWLQGNRIKYVVQGPLERALGNRTVQGQVVWQEGDTTIYRVDGS